MSTSGAALCHDLGDRPRIQRRSLAAGDTPDDPGRGRPPAGAVRGRRRSHRGRQQQHGRDRGGCPRSGRDCGSRARTEHWASAQRRSARGHGRRAGFHRCGRSRSAHAPRGHPRHHERSALHRRRRGHRARSPAPPRPAPSAGVAVAGRADADGPGGHPVLPQVGLRAGRRLRRRCMDGRRHRLLWGSEEAGPANRGRGPAHPVAARATLQPALRPMAARGRP